MHMPEDPLNVGDRHPRVPRQRRASLQASLVTDSLPIQFGLDEAGVKGVEGPTGAHGQRGPGRAVPQSRACHLPGSLSGSLCGLWSATRSDRTDKHAAQISV